MICNGGYFIVRLKKSAWNPVFSGNTASPPGKPLANRSRMHRQR